MFLIQNSIIVHDISGNLRHGMLAVWNCKNPVSFSGKHSLVQKYLLLLSPFILSENTVNYVELDPCHPCGVCCS